MQFVMQRRKKIAGQVEKLLRVTAPLKFGDTAVPQLMAECHSDPQSCQSTNPCRKKRS